HPVILSAAKNLVLIGAAPCHSERSEESPTVAAPCHSERSEESRPHWLCSYCLPFFTQVSPVGIYGLDQGNLLYTQPALYLLLPRDSNVHIGGFFKVH